ncbi:uncharacterized protein LOC128249789 [Octopus bimaculoides]|uniref:uncharacterized protein LOC128249789 n=1 Tax=Octopus bimaculoides TaxID=37653 RepID=UPI0022E971AA|nr:uncharacterized protein LOC128249789 [Octopus bimaculoides]
MMKTLILISILFAGVTAKEFCIEMSEALCPTALKVYPVLNPDVDHCKRLVLLEKCHFFLSKRCTSYFFNIYMKTCKSTTAESAQNGDRQIFIKSLNASFLLILMQIL